MKLLTLTVCLVVLSFMSSDVQACKCANKSLRQKLSSSDFGIIYWHFVFSSLIFNFFLFLFSVMKVEVKKNSESEGNVQKYKIKIRKIYKLPSNNDDTVRLTRNKLFSAKSRAACGVYLEKRETYLVGGKIVLDKPMLSSCGLAVKWSQLSPQEKRALGENGRNQESSHESHEDSSEDIKKLKVKETIKTKTLMKDIE